MTEPAPTIDAFASAALPQMKWRTAKLEWQGRQIWLKKSVPPKGTGWTKLQRILAGFIGLPILRPTANPGGAEGLRIEVWRSAEFRRAGFIVPEILGQSDTWIAMSDLGEMVERKLQKDLTIDDAARHALICRCAVALAETHKAGLSHGRGKLNDFVLTPDNKIGFIDFEEDVDASGIPLPDRQAREIWLFSCSAARFGRDAVEKGWEAYHAVYHDAAVTKSLRRFLKLLAPFLVLARPLRGMMKGDAARAFDGTAVLRGKV
jgi:tRNA A-37 threonylcarbamoyl transferase component Bud32